MPLSSAGFSVFLKPDPVLRRLVFASGLIFGVAGAVLLVRLPLDLWLRGIACSGWVACCARQHLRLRRGYRDIAEIRVGANGFETRDRSGEWHPARLLPGSFVLRRVAWLRLERPGRACHVELLRGGAAGCNDWRRLQVIWRHVGGWPGSC